MFGVGARFRVILQFAEAACEGNMLGAAKVLPTKEQDPMPEQGRTNFREQSIIVDSIRQLDAGDFGPQGTVQWLDTHHAIAWKDVSPSAEAPIALPGAGVQ
ncbi:hypothetical protein CT19425_U350034 [Cupriavidus taiwanensis]|uniref:Uncharacterized protein n=1 Tax=Cupriavidus taiwanensis TaxID=164546 RepID=A0A375I5L5_9BURK|nr:hypothetical protein CT19425_U350034 [Cupriavidus taiwanensis]